MKEEPKLSSFETIILNKLQEISEKHHFNPVQVNRYYKWLRNPKTNNQMQLDFMVSIKNTNLKFAIEVQGKQHYKFIKEFHKSRSDLYKQQQRDTDKFKLCRERKIVLFTIKYSDIKSTMNLEEYLVSYLTKKTKNKPYSRLNTLLNYFIRDKKPDMITLNEWVRFLKS
jgi:hypothetical protein